MIRSTVSLWVEALPPEEQVFDEPQVCIERVDVVDHAAPDPGTDDEARHAQAVPALIDHRWLHVIVEAAPLVPCEKDRRRAPFGPLNHGFHEPRDVRLPVPD